MTVLDRFDDLAREPADLHLAIGVFDGVHLGHRAVLGSALKAARATNGRSLIVTFEPHPARVIRPREAPRLLTGLAHKLRLAAELGIDRALIVPFTPEFSQITARQFVESLLSGGTPIRSISVGQDWRFGCDRSGDLDALAELGAHYRFAVHGVPPLQEGGQVISSTRIRSLVESGELDAASQFLGRRFSLLDTVAPGRQLGRTLGFPTANLACTDLQLPPLGVYAGTATLRGASWAAVANLGCRPTLESQIPTVQLEVHLLDYHGTDFYGEALEIAFVARLRPEQRFESIAALSEQIARDASAARELLRG